MIDWIEELNERSKDDKAIIVGSEVRALVAEIARLEERLGVARGALEEIVTDCRWAEDMHAQDPKALRYALSMTRDRARRALLAALGEG